MPSGLGEGWPPRCLPLCPLHLSAPLVLCPPRRPQEPHKLFPELAALDLAPGRLLSSRSFCLWSVLYTTNISLFRPQRKSLSRPGPGRRTWWQPPNSAFSRGTGRDSPGAGAHREFESVASLTGLPGRGADGATHAGLAAGAPGAFPGSCCLALLLDSMATFRSSHQTRFLKLWLPRGHASRPHWSHLLSWPLEDLRATRFCGRDVRPGLPSLLLPSSAGPGQASRPPSCHVDSG